MRLASWVLWGVLSCICTFACSEPDRSAGTGGTSAAAGAGGQSVGAGGSAGHAGQSGQGDARSFLDQLWSAQCERILKCSIPDDDVSFFGLYLETQARCLDAFRELLGEEPPIQDLLTKIADGSVRLVPAQVAACLAEMRDCSRQSNFGFGPACRAALEGDVPTGGECSRWEECAGDAYCKRDTGTCPGHCVPLGEPGASCQVDHDCQEANGYAFCDRSGDAPVCKRVPFGALASLGKSCSAKPKQVTEVVLCEKDLWCDAPDPSAAVGTCRAPIANGGACDSENDVCVAGHSCRDEISCKPMAIGRSEGAPCDVTAARYCDSFAGLVCTAGECHRPGDGTRGAACVSSDILERVTCAHGLYCNASNGSMGTCEPLLTAGAACRSADECATGTCSGTCAANYCGG